MGGSLICMGLTGKCAFANGRCLTLASIDKANCPRHQFLVDQFGVEGAHDVELGVEWRVMAVIEGWDIAKTWTKEQLEIAGVRITNA